VAYQTQEDSTTIKDKTNSDPECGVGDPNRISKGHNNNNNNSKDQRITPPTPHDQHTTMSKYQWIYLTPGPPITDANTRTTTPTPMPPKRNTTTWQTPQSSKTTNADTPKDHSSTAERLATLLRIVTAACQQTSTTWTLLMIKCNTFHNQTSLPTPTFHSSWHRSMLSPQKTTTP